MHIANNKIRNGASRAWHEWVRWGSSLVLLPVLGVAIWMWSDVQIMKSNRWTSADQAAFATEVWRAIDSKVALAESPPAWFVKRMDGLEAKIESLEVEVAELRAELRAYRRAEE
jgi:hypothetical protein